MSAATASGAIDLSGKETTHASSVDRRGRAYRAGRRPLSIDRGPSRRGENRPMKSIRLRAGKERSRCAGIRGCSKAASPAARPTPARRCASRHSDGSLSRLGRVQPALVDPAARLELRRERADRRRLLRAPRSARRSTRAARWPIASNGVRLVHGEADGPARADRRSLRRPAVGAVPVRRCASAGRRPSPTRCCRRRRASGLYERSDTLGTRARRAGAASGWLRAPADASGARPRSRSRSTAGASPSTSRAATRPASTSTSATTAKRLRRQPCADFGIERVLELLLLHRRLQRRRARRRRDAGDERSIPRRRRCHAPADNVALNGFDAARHEPVDADVNRALRAFLDERRVVRRDRPRPAQARADRRPRRPRGARLQGHQPPRADAAAPRRRVVHVLVLGRHRCRRCSTRSSPAPASTPASTASSTPALGAAPDHPMTINFPGRRIPEGPGRSSSADRRGGQGDPRSRTWHGAR